jgi:hypothetical protein
MNYVQCVLARKSKANETITLVSFIPENLAKLNEVLRLRKKNVWQEGWVVKFVGSKQYTQPYSRKQIKAHRRNTGDSLPKHATTLF